MASDYISSQVKVAHNIYIMHAVCDDLVQGYYGDANEHRCIVDLKAKLAAIENMLRGLLYSIKTADTSREVCAASSKELMDNGDRGEKDGASESTPAA